MIEYHDPHAATSIKTTPYALAIPTGTANALTVGLLANGFPDSENFLNHIAAVLQIHVRTLPSNITIRATRPFLPAQRFWPASRPNVRQSSPPTDTEAAAPPAPCVTE